MQSQTGARKQFSVEWLGQVGILVAKSSMLVTQLDVLDHGATDVLAPCEWRVEVQRQPALAKKVDGTRASKRSSSFIQRRPRD